MLTFGWLSLLATLVIVGLAAVLRGRFYAIFAGVLLGIHSAISSALFPFVGVLAPLAVALQATVFMHFGSLVRARLRPAPFRFLVSVPGSYFSAATLLAFPWAIAVGFGLYPHGVWLPYLFAMLGVWQSLRVSPEQVDVFLDGESVGKLRRHPHGTLREDRPLRLVQITDPHLGPFMPAWRLRRFCERAALQDPDLVLLTGDFITMESHHAEAELSDALAPLAALRGRVFACRGNHDYEAPAVIERSLAAHGIPFLRDEASLLETARGPVQILGLDFHFTERKQRVVAACEKFPRVEGAFRLVLLHDPGAFKHLPDGEADLVLSGHTHGGQLGLLSFGLRSTIVSALSSVPDHGLWALGKNRLYVHRGTGHYGFPLRVGVPAEESVLRLHGAFDRSQAG